MCGTAALFVGTFIEIRSDFPTKWEVDKPGEAVEPRLGRLHEMKLLGPADGSFCYVYVSDFGYTCVQMGNSAVLIRESP
ncbi:hypothetical protein ACFX13_010499 [Malus domestica]